MKSVIQERINTSENPIPRREIFKSIDHVKYNRNLTTFVVCAVFSLSFQAVVLLTKTATNNQVFNLV